MSASKRLLEEMSAEKPQPANDKRKCLRCGEDIPVEEYDEHAEPNSEQLCSYCDHMTNKPD